jgi:hypothetical protein
VVHTPSPVDSGLPAPVTVVHEVTPQPNMSLCRSLLNDR